MSSLFNFFIKIFDIIAKILNPNRALFRREQKQYRQLKDAFGCVTATAGLAITAGVGYFVVNVCKPTIGIPETNESNTSNEYNSRMTIERPLNKHNETKTVKPDTFYIQKKTPNPLNPFKK